MAFVSSKDEADVRARMGRETRRNSQKAVFDARQRLTSSSGTRASFDFELLDEYAGSRLSGVWAVPALLIILGLFTSLWVPPAAAAVWVVLAISANSAVILTPIGDAIMAAGGDTPLHIAGTLTLDHWQGRSEVQLRVADIARPARF
jgi:hypothetical protein